MHEPLHLAFERTRFGGRAEEVYRFLERIARYLAAKSGTGYPEVRLGRKISLFMQALCMSYNLTENRARREEMMSETMMKELWSLPGEAMVLALSAGPFMFRNTCYNRFAHELNLYKEIATLTRVVNQMSQDGPDFRVPPICYLGEMVYRYIILSVDN
jgi:hypothetical protein